MKKMMLAAATLAAGVAMADIVSSDIVGYTQTTLADDSQAISVGFTEVGGTGFNLTSITPNVDGPCYGGIYIEMLDSAGYTIEGGTYYWYQNTSGFRDDGWYNDDGDKIGEDVDDVVFNPGDGLWLTGIDGEALTTAGKVFQADLGLTLADDSQMLGNPYATSIGLAANIEVDAGGPCYGGIYIEMLDSAGYTIEGGTYYWYQSTGGFRDDGWYNDDGDKIGEDVDDVTFPAGTGLWVCGIEDAEFNFTSPIPAN